MTNYQLVIIENGRWEAARSGDFFDGMAGMAYLLTVECENGRLTFDGTREGFVPADLIALYPERFFAIRSGICFQHYLRGQGETMAYDLARSPADNFVYEEKMSWNERLAFVEFLDTHGGVR